MTEHINVAQILLASEAVSLKPSEPFTYASGLKGPIYCDNRTLLSFPEQRTKVISAFCKLIKKEDLKFDSIAGLATAGIPWGALIAQELGVSFVYIRSKPKGHGKGRQVEGRFSQGERSLVIEDLVNQASSMKTCVDAARSEGLVIKNSLSIVDYQTKKAMEVFKQLEIQHYSLASFEQILTQAQEQGLVTDEELSSAKVWHSNPAQW